MNKHLIISMASLATLAITAGGAASAPESKNFVAPLNGSQEVPSRPSNGRGLANLQASAGDSALSFTVIASNIENVFAAHIHCGAPGVSGPIGVTLFGPVAVGGGRTDGILARGTITAPDPGNSCGWADMPTVIAAMRGGATYVNVHTNDGVAPTNTGPGDFPGGEIRGQIQENGPS